MNRRACVTLLGGVAMSWLGPMPIARAQRPSKVPHVVFFSPGTFDDFRTQSFRQGLAELGYVDGQNIAVEYVFSAADRLSQAASDIVARRPNAIVVATTPVALAAMRATATIPIIAAGISDPIATGLADSLARPGRNVTSLSNQATDLAGKRLELMREVLGRLTDVGMLVNGDDAATIAQLEQARSSASALGLTVRMFDVRPGADLGQTFLAIAQGGIQAVTIPQSGWFLNNRAQFAQLAIQHRLPTIVGSRFEAAAGMLLAYGTDLRALFRRSAYQLDKILKGASPADIPVEQPTTFELIINLKTAKALGLEIPSTLLARANEVIE